jgi:Fe-S-cluster-containing hydrogenase component 2
MSQIEALQMGALEIDPEKCTGCKQCELACSWVQVGAFQPSRSQIRVHVFDEQASYAPYACLQCDEAWCMQACPANAIDVDEHTGAKIVIDEVCVGCKLCVIACPFGTMHYDKQADTATKCDLCAGDPACAHACPTGAIAISRVEPGDWLLKFGDKVADNWRAATGEGV